MTGSQDASQFSLAKTDEKKESMTTSKGVVAGGTVIVEVIISLSFKTGLGVGPGVWSWSHWTSSHSMADVASQQTAVQPAKVAVTVGRTRFAI